MTEISHECHAVSNPRQLCCSINSLFRLMNYKHQNSTSLAFCAGNPVDSPHRRPVLCFMHCTYPAPLACSLWWRRWFPFMYCTYPAQPAYSLWWRRWFPFMYCTYPAQPAYSLWWRRWFHFMYCTYPAQPAYSLWWRRWFHAWPGNNHHNESQLHLRRNRRE